MKPFKQIRDYTRDYERKGLILLLLSISLSQSLLCQKIIFHDSTIINISSFNTGQKISKFNIHFIKVLHLCEKIIIVKCADNRNVHFYRKGIVVMKSVIDMKKGLFTAVIMMLFMLALVKIDAKAANVVESKTETGEDYNITWTMYDDGLLDISGAGEAYNLGYSKYKSAIKKVKIGYGITGFSFSYYANLTSITIPNSVTYISKEALQRCSKLKSITIPNSVVRIGSYAFEGCNGLTSITLPDSVKYIDEWAFANNHNIKSVMLSKSLVEIGEDAFCCCDIENLVIPDSVESIGDSAFDSCEYLKKVTISDKLLSNINVDSVFMGSPWYLQKRGPFKGAKGGLFYTIEKDWTLHLSGSGEYAFDAPGFWDPMDVFEAYRDKITTIVISKNSSIGNTEKADWANDFDSLKKIVNNSTSRIYLDSRNDNYKWVDINDKSISIDEISKGTAVILYKYHYRNFKIKFNGNGATSGFMEELNVSSNKSYKLPKNVFVRTGYIFNGWKYSIDGYSYNVADGGRINISEDTLFENVITTISLKAQWKRDPNYWIKKAGTVITDKKSKAKYIVLSSKKKTVKYYRNTNKNATKVSIPATISFDGITYKVTEIDAKALKGNKKVKTVTMGKNITKIGDEAFSGCTALSNVTIGANVTTIGNKAFYNTAIKNLTLPAKTVKLGKQFVYKCSKMKTLTVKSSKMTKKTITDGAYKGLGKSVVVKVPKSKVSAYKKLFQSKGLGKKVKVKANK